MELEAESPQQSVESRLGEVLIVGQGSSNCLRFHDQEAGAVGKTPVFVSPVLVSAQSLFELIACLRYHRDGGVLRRILTASETA